MPRGYPKNPAAAQAKTRATRIRKRTPCLSGKNHPNWRGGKEANIAASEFTEEVKNKIRERDSFICQLCGDTQEQTKRKFPIHHIDYDRNNCAEENLITLCHSCHGSTNFDREYWTNLLQKEVSAKSVVHTVVNRWHFKWPNSKCGNF